MTLRSFKKGFILLILLVTACGGNNTPTPQAVTALPDENGESNFSQSENVFRSDIVDMAPGSSVEIKTPTAQSGEPIYGSVIIKNMKLNFPEGAEAPEVFTQGYLTTPCQKLIYKLDPIDTRNQIGVHIISTTNPKMPCVKRMQPFEQTIRLVQIPSGAYTVWVNGANLGSITIQ